jgi:recombination protein RecA
VAKNKMAPPFREVEFDIIYGKGVSRSGEIVDLASDAGLIQKSGAWFSMGTERIGQGRENARAYLEEHPQVMEQLAAQILAHHKIGEPSPASGEAESKGELDAAANGGAAVNGSAAANGADKGKAANGGPKARPRPN